MYNSKIVKQDLENILKSKINFSKLKNKTVLITGANGMLASYYMYVLMYLNDKMNYNIKIYALVRNEDKLQNLTDFKNRFDIVPIVQDVCSQLNINEKIDYIIHMASSANPKTITTDPVGIINANITGTLNMLELAKTNNAEIIFTSTREVYGKIENKENILESDFGSIDTTEIRSCYPESKRMAENLIISYSYEYEIKYKIARLAHIYGPGMIIDNDGRIMSDLISNIVNNTNIILKSNGEAKRSFCYISDAITALFIITLDNKPNEIYNVSNEKEELSIKDLAYLITNIYPNLNVIFDIKENKNQYVKFARVPLNTQKLEKLGWQVTISLNEGIKRTVEYFNNFRRRNDNEKVHYYN